MPRYLAFLRAVNVGGRLVKMDELRRICESIGLKNVETFIASGNVVFESATKDGRVLEAKIEKTLAEKFGFEVPVFVRTTAELVAIADHQPFTPGELDAAVSLNVGFLADNLPAAAKQNLSGLQTPMDSFHVHQRELYWLSRQRQSESTISLVKLERAMGCRATFRGMNTVKRMASKFCSQR
jgi:uncharacterized protein (DUF1697 family)